MSAASQQNYAFTHIIFSEYLYTQFSQNNILL